MFSLAWKNIIRRLGGSLMTALIAFIAVFVLATSLAVVASLENGLRLSRERLGACLLYTSQVFNGAVTVRRRRGCCAALAAVVFLK